MGQLAIGTEKDGILYIFDIKDGLIGMNYENEDMMIDESFDINIDDAKMIIKYLQDLIE